MREKSMSWTTQEVEDLFNTEVKKSPNNLLVAFTRIGRKLNTSTNNVSKAWYRLYRNKSEMFNISSTDVHMKNVKNVQKPKKVEATVPIHESVISTQKFDGIIVVTTKKYYLA